MPLPSLLDSSPHPALQDHEFAAPSVMPASWVEWEGSNPNRGGKPPAKRKRVFKKHETCDCFAQNGCRGRSWRTSRHNCCGPHDGASYRLVQRDGTRGGCQSC